MRGLFCFILYILFRMTHRLPKVSSIYFHDPTPELFETILRWYRKHHYRIVSINEYFDIINGGTLPDEKIALITLDDGWRSNLKLLPICERYDAPITIFVATEPLVSGNYWWEFVIAKLGFNKMLEFKSYPEPLFYEELTKVKTGMKLERSAMTEEELMKMANHPLVTIQSHTINHPIITNLTDETLHKELQESKHKLEVLTGEPVSVFSYPNGNVSDRETKALEKAGYKYAFTTQSQDIEISKYNPYLLPRRAMNTHGGKYDNLAKLTGVWFTIARMLKS